MSGQKRCSSRGVCICELQASPSQSCTLAASLQQQCYVRSALTLSPCAACICKLQGLLLHCSPAAAVACQARREAVYVSCRLSRGCRGCSSAASLQKQWHVRSGHTLSCLLCICELQASPSQSCPSAAFLQQQWPVRSDVISSPCVACICELRALQGLQGLLLRCVLNLLISRSVWPAYASCRQA